MSDDISIMDQGHDLQVSVSKLNELKVEISNSMQVRAIVTKRPPIGLDTEKKKKTMAYHRKFYFGTYFESFEN